jgi:hypothetical protein
VLGALADAPPHVTAFINAYRGRILLSQGRPRRAIQLLDDAALTLRDFPSVEPSWCIAIAAEAHALLGQTQEARLAAAEARTLRRSGVPAFEVDELRALAWVDTQDGHLSAAIGQLWAAADAAAERGQLCFEIIILDDLLRLGEHRAALRAKDLSQNVDGAWSAAIAAHAIAVRSSAPAALEAAAQAFSAIGSSLVAAELWAAASLAYTHGGLPARAAAASRETGRLLVLCEGALTPVLSSARTPDPSPDVSGRSRLLPPKVPLTRRSLQSCQFRSVRSRVTCTWPSPSSELLAAVSSQTRCGDDHPFSLVLSESQKCSTPTTPVLVRATRPPEPGGGQRLVGTFAWVVDGRDLSG